MNDALLQREYGFFRAADLTLEDYWALEIVAQERHRWEAETHNFIEQWKKQEAKISFQQYLQFIPDLERYR